MSTHTPDAPPLPHIDCLALDLDGTLVLRGAEVPASALAALQRAQDAGIGIVLATGRRFRNTHAVAAQLARPPELVCLGGALLKAPEAGATGWRTLAAHPLDSAVAAAVIRRIRAAGHTPIVQLDRHLSDPHDFLVDTQSRWNTPTAAYVELAAPHVRQADALAHVQAEGALVLSFYSERPTETLLADLVAAFPGALAVNGVRSGAIAGTYCEITAADVDKWRGLRRLAALTGRDLGAVCAVGDERNDLAMVRGAALGVAMGNAHPELKAAADWITRANDDHGIAHLVDRLLEARRC